MKTTFFLVLLCFSNLIHCQTTTKYQKHIVYFDFGESDLSTSELEKLEKFTSNSLFDFSIIKLKAHCDTSGSDDFNIKLASNRLEKIKSLLNINYPLIETIIGETEANLAANYDDSEFRKVEIYYLLVPKPISKPTVADTNLGLTQTIDQFLSNKNTKRVFFDLSILFEPGSPVFLSSSIPELEELTQIMLNNENLNIIIHGHVCCGSEPNLANNRAAAVYKHLRTNKTAKIRMRMVGHDNKDPKVWPERTEEDRIANRRVSIEFIKQ